MQSTILCLSALVACAWAQAYVLPGYTEKDPEFYVRLAMARNFRDMTWNRNAGRGQVFGTLGSTDDSVFGKAGYRQDFFKDQRGHLQGEAYGSRVLGANGDSSVLGGKVNWSSANDNARAALDVHKEIGQGSGMTLSGDGVWKVDKNTRLVAGGNLEKNFGHDKPVIGLEAKIEHDF